MKIILTGSTGFIGGEVLQHCLLSPSITSIIALSRRALPESVTKSSNAAKLKVVIPEDFSKYDDTVLDELRGAEACIWCLGVIRLPTMELTRKVMIDYPTIAAQTFNNTLSAQLQGDGKQKKKFRFIYLSGMLSERDQAKTLWFMQDARRLRGALETSLLAMATSNPDTFETYIAKPGGVISKEGGVMNVLKGMNKSVGVAELAAVMLDAALNGSVGDTFQNEDLRTRGKALLEAVE
ncbi:MAG: hypothetical protein M1827_004339 [Pycnora praestabilis]|nr:MAG: hypothetical protein M1827_004339 [Pycnora praestabilis]